MQGIDWVFLHQRFEFLGQRRLAAADGAEQVEDLFLFFEPLRGMLEERDDFLDGFLHAIEIFEGRIDAQHLVGEQARQLRVLTGVDQCRFTDRAQHALGRRGVGRRVLATQRQIIDEREFFLDSRGIAMHVVIEDAHAALLLAHDWGSMGPDPLR